MTPVNWLSARRSGWGRYPTGAFRIWAASSPDAASAALKAPGARPVLLRGRGRAYGDAALADHLVETAQWDHLLDFDERTGVLVCEAGVSLDDILRIFVPRGWFLSVTPGTRYVSVGGAIAADVHGKNHHQVGSFSEHLLWMDMLLGNGSVHRVSPSEHEELFRATCGGMGLTGGILRAGIRLMRIGSSQIEQTRVIAPSLHELMRAFEAHADAPYSVAWIDCSARGAALGRGVLMLGRHTELGPLRAPQAAQRSMPTDAPSWLLNRWSLVGFNAIYFAAGRLVSRKQRVDLGRFFYPLDGISDWNRLYGGAGFTQYQCVIPRPRAESVLRLMLDRIAASGRGSFLAVLKLLGPANANPLSFPMQGFTLALDFKISEGLWALLDELDGMVLEAGGRLYLAKDARMSEAMFKQSYPRWTEFQAVRARWGAVGVFRSRLAERLGLE